MIILSLVEKKNLISTMQSNKAKSIESFLKYLRDFGEPWDLTGVELLSSFLVFAPDRITSALTKLGPLLSDNNLKE